MFVIRLNVKNLWSRYIWWQEEAVRFWWGSDLFPKVAKGGWLAFEAQTWAHRVRWSCCVLHEALSETRVPPASEKPPKHREDRNFLWFLFVLQLFVFTLLDGFYENGSSAAGLPWLLTSSHFKHGALNKSSLLWPQHVLLTEINKEDSGVVQARVQRQSAFVHREKCFMFKSFKQASQDLFA